MLGLAAWRRKRLPRGTIRPTGGHALKLLKRNILHFTGVAPVRSKFYGMIEAAGDETRRRWLREVEALGHQAR